MKISKRIQYLAIVIMLLFLSPIFGQNQIEIDSVIGDGRDAIRITYAESNGVQIISSKGSGIYVRNTELIGFRVSNAGSNGVHVDDAGSNGVHVHDAGRNGVHVHTAGGDGVFVQNAVGYSMNIQGDKNLGAAPSGHIAQIYNRADGGNADVLALKVGENSNPDGGSNFITFFSGNNASLGRIEGNGTGGVAFLSGAGDFAELLPTHPNEDNFSPGDVIGIVDGKVSLNTEKTDKVMVITDRPIVVGNQQENTDNHEIVGFIGQVPVRVRGKVNAGDWIVASGLSDGTGIGIGSSDITLDHKIVGQAWESNEEEGIKRVLTAIGLDQSEAKDMIIGRMGNRINTQEELLTEQQKSIDHLQQQIDELKRMIIKD